MGREGPGEAVFTANGVAKQGDRGSEVLKQGAPAEQWKRGTVVEVAWGIRCQDSSQMYLV